MMIAFFLGIIVGMVLFLVAGFFVYTKDLKPSATLKEKPADNPAQLVEMEDPLDSINL